jgi:hypothetical protein
MLPAALYVCETWSAIPREKQSKGVWEQDTDEIIWT